MSLPMNKIEKRIRLSGLLIFLALVLEAVSLLWFHPASFLVVHMAAMGLFLLAVAVYLWSLLTAAEPPQTSSEPTA